MKIIVILSVAAVVTSGCTSFVPKPVSPTATLAAYEARTLDNPDLQAFVQKNSPHAAGPWPPAQWNLELLTLAAYYYHPELDVARAKWGVARAGMLTAGMRPNPSINANLQRATGPQAGSAPWTFGLNLDIPIETAGKRGYRIAQASQLSEAARLAISGVAWQVRGRVRVALLDLRSALNTREALLQQQRLQQAQVALLERRLALGMAATPEVTQARIVLNRTTFALDNAAGLQADARARLATALGLRSQALDNIVIAPEQDAALPALPDSEVREQALLHRADVQGALSVYAASQSALQLQIANQFPDLHLGPGYSWNRGARKWSLGLALVLPVFNQNQGPIAEAQARRAEAAASFNATQARALGDVEAALADYRARRASLLTVQALQQAQTDQLRRAETSFNAGATDRATLLGARLELAQIALSRIDAQANTQRALGRLEDAVQLPLAGPGVSASDIQDNPRSPKESHP